MSSSPGLSRSKSPDSVILNIQISHVEPNLFFKLLRSLISSYLSPSKNNTTSTRCSRLFGPATAPSLVIWPMRIKLVAFCFAYCWSVSAIYFIWLILPAVPEALCVFMTLIESMITRSNFWLFILSKISSKFDSQRRDIFFALTQSLWALPEICPIFSSPLTYSTFFHSSQPDIWRESVDFPIPGSHERSTIEPTAIPQPSTLLSSPDWVNILASAIVVSLREWNSFFFPQTFHFLSFVSLNSTRVFHSRQEGHCPIHLIDSDPQVLHRYIRKKVRKRLIRESWKNRCVSFLRREVCILKANLQKIDLFFITTHS